MLYPVIYLFFLHAQTKENDSVWSCSDDDKYDELITLVK